MTLGSCIVTATSLPLTHPTKAVAITKSNFRVFDRFGNASSELFGAKALLAEHPIQLTQTSSLEQKYLQESKDDPSPPPRDPKDPPKKEHDY